MDGPGEKYKSLYKSRISTTSDMGNRHKKLLNEKRNAGRDQLLMNKRNCLAEEDVDMELSPPPLTALQQRQERLKMFKEQKKKEDMAKKMKEKPLFKVYHVTHPIGYSNTFEGLKKVENGKLKLVDEKQGVCSKPVVSGSKNKIVKKEAKTNVSSEGAIASRLRSKTTSSNVKLPTKTTENKVFKINDIKKISTKSTESKVVKTNDIKGKSENAISKQNRLKNQTDKKLLHGGRKVLNSVENKQTHLNEPQPSTSSGAVKKCKFSTPTKKNGQKENQMQFRKTPKRHIHYTEEEEQEEEVEIKEKPVLKHHGTPKNCIPIKDEEEQKEKIEEEPKLELNQSSPEKPTQGLSTTKLTTPKSPPLSEVLADNYISPFVVRSRGKANAAKEYRLRAKQGGLCDSSPAMALVTGPQAGSAYFRRLVNNETARLEKICQDWLDYKDNENPPEEAVDMINTAIGQSNLLINKKFKQFRGLIDNCENGNSEKPVTCTDLHGYWDVAYMQVDNLDKRFANLENLRKNNWEEILPQKQEESEPPKEKVQKRKARKPMGRSNIRDFIKAQRNLQGKSTPIKSLPQAVRRSLVVSALKEEAYNRQLSPLLIRSTAKKLLKELCTENTTENTPSKSILKTPRQPKSSHKKSVLFQAGDSPEENCSADEENSSPVTNNRGYKIKGMQKMDFGDDLIDL